MAQAESIFLNVHIYTLDGQNSITQAMATYEDRILALGSIDKIKTLIGPVTKVVDLNGKAVHLRFWVAVAMQNELSG
jgi:predicted amidohydrolase YtcJ